MGPDKVPLLRPSACTCLNEGKGKTDYNSQINEVTFKNIDETFKTDHYDEQISEISYKNIDGDYYKKILPKDEVFITEKFFDHTVLDQVEILDNFETQAQFVRDLFESENRMNDSKCNGVNRMNDSKCNGVVNFNEVELNEVNFNEVNLDEVNFNEVNLNEVNFNEVDCECKVNEGRRCEVGCGCVCDQCYSTCWPRDWIREDYPEARVISINYTSDPYLWRPLWIKECKR